MKPSLFKLSLLMNALLIPGGAYAADILGANERDVIPGQYIVVYKDAADLAALGGSKKPTSAAVLAAQQLQRLGESMASSPRLTVKRTFDNALRAAVMQTDEHTARLLADDPLVAYVEADRRVYEESSQTNATWGLDRIDQASLPLDQVFTSPDHAGAGVHVYVIDSGLNGDHKEFEGRVKAGYSVVSDGRGTGDCTGHGTHVASSATGSTWGVAKKASLVPVRVFSCDGSASTSTIIDGMDWVVQHAVKPAVANLSLGGGASTAQDAAVKRMTDAGVVVVVAAGNQAVEACSRSPARAESAITVGGSAKTDTAYNNGNYGACVDILAPAVSVTGAAHDSNTGSALKTGTSMASPHVAGAAALYLASNLQASVAQVTKALIDNAVPGKVTGLQSGTVNKLLNIGFLNTPDSGGGGGGETPSPVALRSGVAVTGLSIALGESRRFTLTVPAGTTQVQFETSGSNGDVDLFARAGEPAERTVADCLSKSSDSNERCVVTAVVPGTYHVLVYGYKAATGISVKATVSANSSTPVCEGLAEWVSTKTYPAGAEVRYKNVKYRALFSAWGWSPDQSMSWKRVGAC